MKTKTFLRLISVFSIALLLVWATVSVVLGQQPDLPQVESTLEPAGEISAMAQSPTTMNYQGYLADSGGTPLNGTHTLTFALYSEASGGSRLWGPETHNNVQLDNGLFSVVLGSVIGGPLPSHFQYALFLAMGVDGTGLSTRQPLRPSAYAFSMTPGAIITGTVPSVIIEGSPGITRSYALRVVNSSDWTNIEDVGLLAQGTKYGLRAVKQGGTASGDQVAIYAENFIEAVQGYRSQAPSYWWIPGMSGVSTTGLTMTPSLTGTAVLNSSSTGQKYFYVPVALPSQMFGQEVIVKELTLYYYTSNGSSPINSVRLEKLTSADASTTLINSTGLTLNSTTATSTTIAATGAYTLTADSGPLNVQLGLNFNNTADTIYVGGVRLKLQHYE